MICWLWVYHWKRDHDFTTIARQKAIQFPLTARPASLLCMLTCALKSRPFSRASTNFLEKLSAKWILSLHPPHCHPSLLTPRYRRSHEHAFSFPWLHARAIECDTPADVMEYVNAVSRQAKTKKDINIDIIPTKLAFLGSARNSPARSFLWWDCKSSSHALANFFSDFQNLIKTFYDFWKKSNMHQFQILTLYKYSIFPLYTYGCKNRRKNCSCERLKRLNPNWNNSDFTILEMTSFITIQ